MTNGQPIRVLQAVPSMGHGGIEHFLMNLYRAIDKDKVQFDFMYRVPYACVFDKEIEAMGGRIFRCIDPDTSTARAATGSSGSCARLSVQACLCASCIRTTPRRGGQTTR